MALNEFEENDVFVNVMKTYPHCKFTIYNGQVYYKKDFGNAVPTGYTALYDLNLDAPNR